ncbi:MAG: Ribonucleoside-diphosphate reductase [Candidatus Peregrinibacteria bacterium GW2011_GWA2_33_10]|nr:MAG: Ribonucleoside-diphosphate reductase [Candidatus Peregrinibacteria bacterium GW2011_GWA2_33_10]KKP40940.1 MAG: ribonucleoside-diphosphate reductase subunit alpha, ribonucleoside-diphosphate reductase alpha chain [Candidatus Peregrinibacteria bacterium GW2011_GWC2_33_13]OGJ49582.1 MAG: ribonucleotide-diphosphate reductase subunit alpha [Candidatus Peregrinibacteria bacterium RIFOXYA2_FULL_33_7]
MIKSIKKRSGEVVEFDGEKLAIAIQKAFHATIPNIKDHQIFIRITEGSIFEIKQKFSNQIPSVEDIQDIVEKKIAEFGYYEVAKAYILYRYEHGLDRDLNLENQNKPLNNEFWVIKRNGVREKFDPNKIRNILKLFSNDLKNIDIEKIVSDSGNNLFDYVETKQILNALVLSTRSFIEKDPDYSRLAARLLLNLIYQEVFNGEEKLNYDSLEKQYRDAFVRGISRGVATGKLDKRMQEFDLSDLAAHLNIERDNLLLYLGLQVLYDRYFIRLNPDNKLIEAPQIFWMRVAMGIALNEKKNKQEFAKKFYDTISGLDFVPSTPTLFHAGTSKPQLSSCYLTTIEDSLEGIFKGITDNARLSKWSGGLGNDWSGVRGTGAFIKGTGVTSQGVIPFLKIANDVTVAINRSGRRRGATCAYLETWHLDIEEFLELRKNTGDERRRTHDMNTANWVPDLFMKRVKENKDWTLFSPDETPDLHDLYGKNFEDKYVYYESLAEEGKIKLFKKVKAENLWKKMITMLFETGHPWITFKDVSNIRSPQDHTGVIHSSNLCTEITLNTSEKETAVCNLGSINLSKHIKEKSLDLGKLKETINNAMRMLDNVIDINFYPTKEAENSNKKHRPVGLGIMGFADALYMQNINFDSKEALDFSDKSMEIISYYAIYSSMELAKEKGAYKSFSGSKWDRGIFPLDTLDLLARERGEQIKVDRKFRLDWDKLKESVKENGIRNSNCLAIAPTATISNIAGCIPSIEPIYKNMYVKSNMSGEFIIVNHYLIEDLKIFNLWNEDILEEIKSNDGDISKISKIPEKIRDKYKEAFDIDPKVLIDLAAHRGKWLDQSQSLNLFFRGTSGRQISDIYFYAWETGLKTTYYLRSLAASSVEKSTLDIKKQERVLSSKDICKVGDPDCEACQ